MLYIAYLDEFGHIGPYISHDDQKHKTHPVFGIGGFVLPYEEVRNFSTFFFKIKNNLLAYDINKAKQKKANFHVAKWEKKGSGVFSVRNVEKYRELRNTTNRIINKISSKGGFTFYVGREKRRGIEKHDPVRLYNSVFLEAIKRLDQECSQRGAKLMIVIDEHHDRARIVEAASIAMFGDSKKQLVEPPMQVESHLYQTIQCADWLCAIYGKLSHYLCEPEVKAENQVFEKFFKERLERSQKRSSIRTRPIEITQEPLVQPQQDLIIVD